MRTNVKFAALAVAVALATAVPTVGAGGLQDKMDSVFGSMSNYSQPGVFETQRRGVLSGGSLYVRNPVVDVSLVNMQLPSIKASCGGIDMFGGSFSFINASQFVELLRAVAANAKGYAFNIALDVACSQCMSWINALQQKIQKLNELSANSCQLAQGLINDLTPGLESKRKSDYSIVGMVSGVYDDIFQASNQSDGRDLKSEVETKKPEQAKNLIGNIVWQELKKNGVKGWITDPADEADEYGILMAVSGSVIIPKSVEDTKNPDTGNTTNPKYLPHKIEFKNLLDGGKLKIYSCKTDDTECLEPEKKEVTTVGMVKRIKDVLEGDGTSVGVIQKFGMNTDNAFTASESNLMGALPQNIGMIIRNLSTASADTAKSQAEEIAYAVAMAMAYDVLNDHLKAVEQAVRTSTKPEVKQMIEQVRDRRKALAADYDAYSKNHKTVAQIMDFYNQVQQNMGKVVVTANRQIQAATQGEK